MRRDEREQFAGSHAVERDEETKFSLDVRVLLHRQQTRRSIHRSHVVEEAAAGKFEAAPRMDDDGAFGLFARDFFDGGNGHRHGEELADFGFVDV